MCGKDAHCPRLLAHFVSSSFPIQVDCCGYFFLLLLPLVDCCGILSSHLHNWFFVFLFLALNCTMPLFPFSLLLFIMPMPQCHSPNATLGTLLSRCHSLEVLFILSSCHCPELEFLKFFYNVIFWIMEILCCPSVSTNIELACIIPPTTQALSQKNQQSNNAVGGNSKFLEIGNLAAGWP